MGVKEAYLRCGSSCQMHPSSFSIRGALDNRAQVKGLDAFPVQYIVVSKPLLWTFKQFLLHLFLLLSKQVCANTNI